jgi:hypothetical protein
MAKGTLIAAMHMAQVAEDEFHDWYDTEHLPERQRVPGFLACQRWIGAEDGRSPSPPTISTAWPSSRAPRTWPSAERISRRGPSA